MAKDELFKNGGPSEFRFDEQVAEVFDDMLARSVPGYGQVIGITGQFLARFLQAGDLVYDLGCSTGNTLLELARRLEGSEIRFLGLDSSPAMIEKASRKAGLYAQGRKVRFQQTDITRAELERAGAVLLHYTLQFLRPPQRPLLLQKIHRALRPGGLLILSEKVTQAEPALHQAFSGLHDEFKRSRGYSELEIAKKRESLENILVPFSLDQNRALLQEAGFQRVEPFFQWCNFVSWVAVR